jgi:pre-rRNA-processing protein TSR2
MSTSAQQSTPNLALFARGTIALFTLWPALRLAVAEQWGGPESAEKRTWMISEVVDYFESCLPKSTEPQLSEDQLADLVDQDELAEMLEGMVSDEFEVDLDDGSADEVAGDVVKLWKKLTKGDKAMVEELEELVRSTAGKKVQAQGHGDDEQELDEDGNLLEGSDDSSDDDDVEMANTEGPPEPKEKQEPVVDDDGFTLVQKKGKK